MVHHVEVQALKIGHIAWKVERNDLPATASDHLIPANEAVEDQAAFRWPVAFANDVPVFRNRLQPQGKSGESSVIDALEGRDGFELTNEARVMGRDVGHASAPFPCWREHVW
jgi:hypothetical protein